MLAQDFLRKCRAFGILIRQGKGSHIVLYKVIDRETRTYVVPVHGGKIGPVYIPKTRRVFKLLPEDGVSDAAWREA